MKVSFIGACHKSLINKCQAKNECKPLSTSYSTDVHSRECCLIAPMGISNKYNINFCARPKIKFPIEETEALLKKALTEISEAVTPEDKISLCDKAIKDSISLNDNFAPPRAERTEGETSMIHDFIHESGGLPNVLGHKHILPFNDIGEDHKPLSPDFYDDCKMVFAEMINIHRRFQFFVDNGLSNRGNKLSDIFGLAIKPIENLAKSKGININIEGGDIIKSGDIKIPIEDFSIYTIFANVLQNAVKYTPDNGNIDVRFLKRECPSGANIFGNHILDFSVQDSGIGIPPAEFENVVHGVRASNAVESGIQGTGRGLRRVRSILRFAYQEPTIISPVNTDVIGMPGTKIVCPMPLMAAE